MKTLLVAFILSILSTMATAVTLCERYGYYEKEGYYFNNNRWGQDDGTGDQCTYIDSVSSDGVVWHTSWTWQGGENNVKAYPYSGRLLPEKKLVSSISSMPASVSWDYSGNNVRANVAYDLFTAADPNHV